MGGEGDGLVAVEHLGAADVVVKDPVLLAPVRGGNPIGLKNWPIIIGPKYTYLPKL